MARPTISFEGSPALVQFRRSVGDASRHLNTLLIGLETLRHSTPVKPPDILLGWTKPTLPAEWEGARDTALKMAMVALVDALDQYLRTISRIPNFTNPALLDALMGRKGTAQRRPTLGERFDAVRAAYPTVISIYQTLALHLLVYWRNDFVHGDYRFRLSAAQDAALRGGAAHFKAGYGSADIIGALDRYQRREPPLMPDLITLFTVGQRVVGGLDEHLLFLQSGSAYAHSLLQFIVSSQADPEQFIQQVWGNGGQEAIGSVHSLFLHNGGNHDKHRRASAPQLTERDFRTLIPPNVSGAKALFL